ncbi:hypothetical protein HZC30_02165 [Candidatus Woesearchaeota archaeon]|nr:hypothetical protein [Candidatus Woesearchaeota archaeon]
MEPALKKSKKKGITPLMATFLLISFAVAVGVVVMNLGSAQVEESAQCPINIGLKLSNIGGQDQLCYDVGAKELKFTLENGINIKVEGLIVNIIGTDKAESYEFNEAKVGKAGTYLGKADYDSAVAGEIRQLKISPKVVLYDTEQICTEQALVAEMVRNC